MTHDKDCTLPEPLLAMLSESGLEALPRARADPKPCHAGGAPEVLGIGAL